MRRDGRKIKDVVFEATGETFPLKYSTERGEFNVRISDDTIFWSAKAQEVEDQAIEALEQRLKVEWLPVVIVMIDAESPCVYGSGFHDLTSAMQHRGIGFACMRAAIGQLNPMKGFAQDWRLITWAAFENKNYSHAQRLVNARKLGLQVKDLAHPLPHSEGVSNDRYRGGEQVATHFLPYDDALWAGVEQIGGLIENARFQITEIIGAAEGRVALAKLGAKALGNLLPAAGKSSASSREGR